MVKLNGLTLISLLLLFCTLTVIIIGILYRWFFILNSTSLFVIIIPSSVAAYYCKKFLENFEKNEQYVATLIFIHPKIRERFKLIFIATFIFGIVWCLSILRRYEEKNFIINLIIGSVIPFSSYLILIIFIYFFKDLYEITRSD